MKKTNWEILSLTRFLFSILVITSHLRNYTNIGGLQYYLYLGGFEAILGFLLLSGMSIGISIQKDRQGYFQRRIKRIYPVYLICLLTQLVINNVLGGGTHFSILILLFNLLFLNQIFTSTSLIGPAWTLSLEVWLYTLAPFFVKRKKRELIVLMLLSFGCYIMNTIGRSLFHWPFYAATTYGINLILLGFIWIAGFTYALFPKDLKIRQLIMLMLAGHLLLSFGLESIHYLKHHQAKLIISESFPWFIGKTICVLWGYIIVVNNDQFPKVKNKSVSTLMELLGNLSYPIYLSHIAVFTVLKKYGVVDPIAYILVAITFSYIIFFLFDIYHKKKNRS